MDTKKCISLSFAILFTISLSAQYKAGLRIGTNLNQVAVSGAPDVITDMTKLHTGVKVGGYVETVWIDDFSIAAELNYAQRGFSLSEGTSFNLLGLDIPVGVSTDVALNYLEVPALLKYYFRNDKIKLSVEGGPSLSYALNGELRPKATLLFDYNLPRTNIDFSSDTYRRFEWAGNIGLGAELPIQKTNGALTANVRYTKAFTNVLSDQLIDIDVKNKGWSLGVGYAVHF